MKNYKVEMTVQGNSTNEVASKIMVAAYAQEFEISALDVFEETGEVRFLTEVQLTDDEREFEQEFHFPHVAKLIDELQKRNKDAS